MSTQEHSPIFEILDWENNQTLSQEVHTVWENTAAEVLRALYKEEWFLRILWILPWEKFNPSVHVEALWVVRPLHKQQTSAQYEEENLQNAA